MCLFRLLKFKPEIKNLGLDEVDEKKSIDDFAIKLESNGLLTFQNRIFNKFFNFAYFIKTHPNAPSQLKEEENT